MIVSLYKTGAINLELGPWCFASRCKRAITSLLLSHQSRFGKSHRWSGGAVWKKKHLAPGKTYVVVICKVQDLTVEIESIPSARCAIYACIVGIDSYEKNVFWKPHFEQQWKTHTGYMFKNTGYVVNKDPYTFSNDLWKSLYNWVVTSYN